MTVPTVFPIAAEALPAELQEALRPRVNRLGYLGMFFRCAAHQPDALLAFMRFTDELKDAVTTRHTEVVALTVAVALDNEYERNQHERLCVALGFDRDWVAAVERLEPGTAGELASDEVVVQQLVLQLVATSGRDAGGQMAAAVDALGEPETVGVLMLTGRYMAHAVMANAFGVEPPVAGIFDEQEGRA